MDKTSTSEIEIDVELFKGKMLLVNLEEQLKKQNQTHMLETAVASLKKKLFETGKLNKMGCLFCENPKGPSFVTMDEREEHALINRTDISFSGFHCTEKPYHAQLFHD